MQINRHIFRLRSKGRWFLVASVMCLVVTFTPVSVSPERGVDVQVAQATLSVFDPIDFVLEQDDLIKELALDKVAFMVAKQAVSDMTNSIVQWINSGFEGSPMFVTDLEGYLTGIADQIAGQFIQGSDLGFLCSPFKLDVQLVLQQSYSQRFQQRSSCTLSGVVGNMEQFLSGANGSFSQGGWNGWFQLTQRQQNNPFGSYQLAQAELRARIVNARGQELELLRFGDGFLSSKECTTKAGTGEEVCTVVTPGQTIADQLNKSLGAGQDALIEADEINEIISALMGQLAQQAITGARGLLGVSQGGSNSYLNSGGSGGAIGAQNTTLSPVRSTIRHEEDALFTHEDIVAIVDSVEDELDAAGSCASTLSMPSELTTARDDSIDAVTDITETLDILFQIESTFTDPNASSQELQAATDLYNELRDSGRLHTEEELTAIEDTFTEVTEEANSFRNDIDAACP